MGPASQSDFSAEADLWILDYYRDLVLLHSKKEKSAELHDPPLRGVMVASGEPHDDRMIYARVQVLK